MSPEQIAEDCGLDLLSVKAVLLQSSSLYRKESKDNESLQFSEDEATECKKIILNLARYSEDEHLQFRSARYVLDSKTGRLDAGKGLQQVQFNVVNFNQQMQKAIEAAKSTEKKAIDVKSVSTSTKELASVE
jgi:hypothetical protein